MTDLQERITAAGLVFDPDKIISVPLKNGAGTVDVYTGILPDDVYREALMQGLKVIAERAMSKLTKEAYPDEAERKAAIHAKASANVEDMYDGNIKITGAVAVKKATGAENTEAMRLARMLVKDAMRAEKIKVSTVKAADITAAAKAFLAADPSILETAKANVAARAATPSKINISSLIKADPELVAKAEKKAADAKKDKPLSKTQAGKVAPRAKAKPEAVVAAKATEHKAGHTAH